MLNDNNVKKTIINGDSGNVYLFIYFALWLCISLITIISAISSFIVNIEALDSIYDNNFKNLYIAILCINIIAGIATFVLPILGLYKLKDGTCSENVLIIIAMIPILINILSSVISQTIMMNISQTSIQIATIIVAIISLGFIIGAMSVDATLNSLAKKICIFISLIGFLFIYVLPFVLTNNVVSAMDTIQIISNVMCIPMLFLYALVEIV